MLSLTNISILVIISAISYKLFYNSLRRIYVTLSIPGPRAYPIIGNGLWFINKTSAENLLIIKHLIATYGEYWRFWIGTDLNIMLTNPNDIEVFLNNSKYIEKSSLYEFIKPWLKEGLLLSKGKKWFQRRKILTPAFHFKILEKFIENFDHQSGILVDNLLKLDNLENVELYPIVTLCALDVICDSAMGVTVNAQSNADSEYVRSVKRISAIMHLRMFRYWLQQDFYFRWTKLYQEQKKALKVLHDFTDSVIKERRKEIVENAQNGVNVDNVDEDNLYIGTKKRHAFLDILLRSTIEGQPLSDLDIREEVDTFMFEGHDTTTSAIVFGLYNIALRPEVQAKCYKEIIEVLGTDKTEPVTLTKLNNLNYLELVIKETLRLFPSVPLIGRRVKEEITINGKTLPAGCNAVVPIYFIGQNPKAFENPEQFKPERFYEETLNPFAFVPFSAGPRNCIGQKFAMLELKSLLTKVLRYFEIGLTEDSKRHPRLQAELILSSEYKINFSLKRRP